VEQAQGKAAEMVAAVKAAAAKVAVMPGKAFIVDVFEALKAEGSIDCDLDTFKWWMDRARNRRWVSLCRCDLVEAFSPEKIRRSEIAIDPRDSTATRHFVRVAA